MSSCKKRCPYSQYCSAVGSEYTDPFECGNYYKIDDMVMEARDIQREQKRIRAEEFGIDESEVDDW